MKSLNTYINEGFFNNVGAVPFDVNKWVEAYNKSRVSKPINMDYVDIDKYGNAVFHPKALISPGGVVGYLHIVVDDKNKDILIPNGALPPNISFSNENNEKWTSVQISIYEDTIDVKSMVGFPTKMRHFEICYAYPLSRKCHPIHANLSDWGATKCTSINLKGVVIDDVKYLPVCEKLNIDTHISLVYNPAFDNMMSSLISKWNGWREVRRLDLDFGSSRLISDKGLDLVHKIDEFIKNKYPDMYACRDYSNIEHLMNTPGRNLDMAFDPLFRNTYIDINDLRK